MTELEDDDALFPDDDTADLAVTDPLLGKTLQNKYEIRRRLGAGGMGVVYEARHKLIDKKVAIKLLHAQYAADQSIVKRFRREAQAAAGIHHPNIIEVTDMGASEGALFIVLELLEGRSLADALEQDGAMTLGRVVHLVSQICDGLGAAHEQGFVHRDLKPDNVFLIRRGNDSDYVKLLDFGIAKVMDSVGGATKLTRTGAPIGTPYYMAPEQAAAKKDIDQRADIFSLGVMIYQMLTGLLPFEDESYPALLVKVCTADPTPIRALRPDLPEEIAAILDKMIAKDRDARFRDCAEVKAAWLPFRNHADAPVVHADAHVPTPVTIGEKPRPSQAAGTPAPPSGPRDRPETAPEVVPPKRKNLLAMGAALGVLGAAGIAAAVILTGGGDQSAPPDVGTAPTSDPTETTTTVHVVISVAPPEATLLLDGEPLANPFEGELPASTTPHHLEARLEGHRTESRDVLLQVPQRIALVLRPEGPDEPTNVETTETAEAAEPSSGDARDARSSSRDRRGRTSSEHNGSNRSNATNGSASTAAGSNGSPADDTPVTPTRTAETTMSSATTTPTTTTTTATTTTTTPTTTDPHGGSADTDMQREPLKRVRF